uniref:ENDOLYSIN n=1 Tax=Clostridium phage phiCTP1 TaxID=871584 RepID=UPI000737D83E|nr:Chain B, ENDOLYSIN [Clostridium phage phiCTP1]
MENLVVYNDGADQRAAEYLADRLACPTINNARKFDYSNVKNVYAVGGNKEQYTSYLTTLIAGSTRYTTMQAVLDYIKNLK